MYSSGDHQYYAVLYHVYQFNTIHNGNTATCNFVSALRYILNNLKILLGKSFNPVVGFKNSFVISIGSTALAAYFSSLTAYALVAYDWKLRQPFFRFIMCVMMIPAQVTTIGFYQMVYKIGLTNHLAMLILPAIASPTMVFS